MKRINSQAHESGRIESIELVNFMCHRHLSISLCPSINFIIGNNGSGKSAILTALTLSLGGRATSTQRATNLDSLIREGTKTAKIRIKIQNSGTNSYLYDIYGEHIIIERILKRDGAGSYSTISASGSQISSRKDEIIAICDHFGIQVDNPLAVLTQETAKKFLANSRPGDLYEVYLLFKD